ncbi:MAG: GIY-YIG nuclease family protein [Candidatus Moraniibacteriota bacterium]
MSNEAIKNKLKHLPISPGIYIFKNKIGEIIYVGKATSLKSRVGSYFRFANDVNMQLGIARPIERMIAQVVDMEIIETETVLEALMLEATWIKKHQPKYNVDGKDDKTFSYVIITKEDFPRVLIVRETDLTLIKNEKLKIKNEDCGVNKKIQNSKFKIQNSFVYGPYTSKTQIQIALKIIRKIFPYHSRKEKSEKGCLEFQIGLCPGPYAGVILKNDYKKNIQGVKMILAGKKKSLLKFLEKEMLAYAKEEKFEKALEIKNKIFALRHIQEIALLSGETKSRVTKNLRIEAYDISNISGDFAVGSMVVFAGGESDKSQYRKFKIKTISGSDDVAMLAEVLRRRFKNSWKLPNLIIVDGGKGHFNMGKKILLENNLNIPIIGVAKGPTRKKLEIIGGAEIKNKKVIEILKDDKLLKRITDEAHRFAVTYHKKIRDKDLLK